MLDDLRNNLIHKIQGRTIMPSDLKDALKQASIILKECITAQENYNNAMISLNAKTLELLLRAMRAADAINNDVILALATVSNRV